MHDLIDSHCHLDFEAFDEDRQAVIKRARSAGVRDIVIPGVNRGKWERIRDICMRDEHIHACYGLHPYMAEQHQGRDIEKLDRWLNNNDCIAVGECGLDYRKDQADRQLQLRYFNAQIELASATGKPVVVHAVRATEDVIRSIRKHPGLSGMVHSFSGSYEQALQLIDMGFYISFGGNITHENATRLRKTASTLPLEAILLETDAPDQPDAAHENQRNEPAYLVNVLKCLGELREEPIEQIASQTTSNARELFQI